MGGLQASGSVGQYTGTQEAFVLKVRCSFLGSLDEAFPSCLTQAERKYLAEAPWLFRYAFMRVLPYLAGTLVTHGEVSHSTFCPSQPLQDLHPLAGQPGLFETNRRAHKAYVAAVDRRGDEFSPLNSLGDGNLWKGHVAIWFHFSDCRMWK